MDKNFTITGDNMVFTDHDTGAEYKIVEFSLKTEKIKEPVKWPTFRESFLAAKNQPPVPFEEPAPFDPVGKIDIGVKPGSFIAFPGGPEVAETRYQHAGFHPSKVN